MEDISAAQALANFAQLHAGIIIQSTSATVVTYAGDLYNVIGSTDDPKIDGASWKQLLIDKGIGTGANDHCYVTSPLPAPTEKTTHPEFNVGGHMTINSDGSVPAGGTCYLMPLCKWHNSASRTMAFSHSLTTILKLSGYMQAELAATFLARMPSSAPYTLVGVNGSNVFTADVDGLDTVSAWKGQQDASIGGSFPEHYILFRQIREGDKVSYIIEDTRLPDVAAK